MVKWGLTATQHCGEAGSIVPDGRDGTGRPKRGSKVERGLSIACLDSAPLGFQGFAVAPCGDSAGDGGSLVFECGLGTGQHIIPDDLRPISVEQGLWHASP